MVNRSLKIYRLVHNVEWGYLSWFRVKRETCNPRGVPGIGKSAHVNAMLLRFLPMIGQPDWPRVALYRCASDMVFEFMLDADGSPVVERLGPSETGIFFTG